MIKKKYMWIIDKKKLWKLIDNDKLCKSMYIQDKIFNWNSQAKICLTFGLANYCVKIIYINIHKQVTTKQNNGRLPSNEITSNKKTE